jgi:putative hemolysin
MKFLLRTALLSCKNALFLPSKHMEGPKKIIDIDRAFKDKNPTLYKLLPGFILSAIKRIIHQEEINRHLTENINKNGAQYSQAAIDVLGVKLSSGGLDNIPGTGGVIIASNHPLGGVDGMALIAEVAKVRKDIKFIVNDLLMQFPQFEDVFVPVNKHGTNTKQNLEKIAKLYTEGHCILIFPAGLCSRRQQGRILDLKWQKSFLSAAIKYHLPVVPAYIEGKNSDRFYTIANIRKRLGIKANIEMFFLADEMFKQKDKTISITFGKIIKPEIFDKTHSTDDWAQKIKHYIYTLKQEPETDFVSYLKNHQEQTFATSNR